MRKNPKANISEIEMLLEYISVLSKQLRESYSFLSDTEFGGMMHNILLGMRRLESEIIDIERRQRKTLLNVVSFDIDEVKNFVSHIMVDIEDAQMFDVQDKSDLVNTNWQEAISLENQKAPFTLGDDYAEYTDTRIFLMKNIRPNFFKIVDSVKNIKVHLDDLSDQIINILYSKETRSQIYHEMIIDYQKNEWGQDYANFIFQTKLVVEEGAKRGKDVEEVLNNELRSLTSENYNTFVSPAIRAVFKTVTSPKLSPADAIAKNRMKLYEDDISGFFSYYFRYSLLKNHLDSLPLLEPAKGNYAQLFVNRAAKEYVDILKPIIWEKGGIQEKGHFGLLLLAMNDLKLAHKENIPMMHYANEINTNNERLRFNKDQSMIGKVAGKIGNTPFFELEYGEVGDSDFDPAKIKGYQDVYVRCFSILNYGGLVKNDEISLASYIKQQADSTILDYLQSSIRDRLVFLRSVLRRETILFD